MTDTTVIPTEECFYISKKSEMRLLAALQAGQGHYTDAEAGCVVKAAKRAQRQMFIFWRIAEGALKVSMQHGELIFSPWVTNTALKFGSFKKLSMKQIKSRWLRALSAGLGRKYTKAEAQVLFHEAERALNRGTLFLLAAAKSDMRILVTSSGKVEIYSLCATCEERLTKN